MTTYRRPQGQPATRNDGKPRGTEANSRWRDNVAWVGASPDECWLWTAFIPKDGYARILHWKADGRRGCRMAHRYIYEELVGPIPKGHVLDHLCRVKHCVNPAHLEPVTPAENTRRALDLHRNAVKTHCHRGHEFTPENTYICMATGRPRRVCLTCRRAYDRRRWPARSAARARARSEQNDRRNDAKSDS